MLPKYMNDLILAVIERDKIEMYKYATRFV